MSETKVIIKPKITPKDESQRPPMYAVILHNDPMTPRAFVVLALKKCFQKINEEAQKIMMDAHENGHSVVATFPREIAEMKAAKANDFSSQQGFVLLFTAEKS